MHISTAIDYEPQKRLVVQCAVGLNMIVSNQQGDWVPPLPDKSVRGGSENTFTSGRGVCSATMLVGGTRRAWGLNMSGLFSSANCRSSCQPKPQTWVHIILERAGVFWNESWIFQWDLRFLGYEYRRIVQGPPCRVGTVGNWSGT